MINDEDEGKKMYDCRVWIGKDFAVAISNMFSRCPKISNLLQYMKDKNFKYIDTIQGSIYFEKVKNEKE